MTQLRIFQTAYVKKSARRGVTFLSVWERGASNVGTYTHDVCAEFGSYLWLCIETNV